VWSAIASPPPASLGELELEQAQSEPKATRAVKATASLISPLRGACF
jgi:hypothetical protein